MTSHRRGFITRLSQARSSRHVEVQVVTDAVGDVWTLGVRTAACNSATRRVIEESASTGAGSLPNDRVPCGQRWILHPSI